MLVEMRERSQITFPSGIIKNLGITKGEKFEANIKPQTQSNNYL